MDIAGGLSATSNAINIVKALKETDHALDSAVLKARLLEVLDQLIDVKSSQLELTERVRELEKENARLLTTSDDLADLVDKGGYLYKQEGNGLIGWPACPSCLNKDRRVVFMVQDRDYKSAKCPRCKSEFSPVTGYVLPGYSFADEREDKLRRRNEKLNARLRDLNR
ncbi:MAG: hypothetical protein AAF697_01825 [Pseudomonadota bacterium]